MVNRGKSLFKYTALIIILTLWYSNVFAYQVSKTTGGADIKWFTSNVFYYINQSGGPSDNLSAIQAAMQTWMDVATSSFTFIYGGPTTSTAHGVNDGVNIVTFGPIGLTGTLAENHYWYSVSSGQLLDSDIQFNTDYTWATDGSASAYDVQNIGTHEFGHSLSLDDLYDAADSEKTMYGYSSLGETKKRTLDQDDIDGITYLYPTLSVTLTANPSSGIAPLNTTLIADVSGSATGTINYTFWWNCNDHRTSVSSVSSVCGDPWNPAYGAIFENIDDDLKTVNHTYSTADTYTAKVITERGTAPPAEARTTVTACSIPGSFSYISPFNEATNQARDVDLDWGDSSGTTSYDVYFGTSNPPPFSINKTSSYYDPGVLNYGTTYYWKIVAKNSCSDTSGSIWSFTTSSVSEVTLFTLNGGEVIPSGSTYSITWVAPPGAVKFKLMYSMNNGTTWKKIHSEPYVIGTSYDWQLPIPSNNKKKCLVKVIGFNNSGVKVGTDKSDAQFMIEVVRLTSPDGGETLTSGDPLTITWTTNDTMNPVTRVRLFYTKNGGVSWKPITTITGSNPGSFDCTVPMVTKEKTKCKVKVILKDANGKTVGSDASDGYFTIQPTP